MMLSSWHESLRESIHNGKEQPSLFSPRPVQRLQQSNSRSADYGNTLDTLCRPWFSLFLGRTSHARLHTRGVTIRMGSSRGVTTRMAALRLYHGRRNVRDRDRLRVQPWNKASLLTGPELSLSRFRCLLVLK